jgi:ParB-like chromosome segregation protein Spo0J
MKHRDRQAARAPSVSYRELPLTKIDGWKRNPRRMTPEARAALAASLTRYGQVETLCVRPTGGGRWELIGGHQRAELLREAGSRAARCLVVDGLDDDRAAALALSLNSGTLAGEWTADLGPLLDELRERLGETTLLDLRLEELRQEIAEDAALGLGVAEIPPPELPSGDRAPFQEMTFILSDGQARQVKSALAQARAAGPFDEAENANSNGNALTRVAEAYLGRS